MPRPTPTPETAATREQAAKAAQSLLWTAGGSAAATAATGGVVTGSAAVSSILGAAGVSATVPVAGWIVAGGLLATAGVVAILQHFLNAGRQAAMMEALKWGQGGIDFAREFADHADKDVNRLLRRQVYLRGRLAAKLAATGRFGQRLRQQRADTLMDRLNANTVLLAMRASAPPQVPAIAGDPKSTTAAVATAFTFDATPLLVGGGILIVLTAVAIAAQRR